MSDFVTCRRCKSSVSMTTYNTSESCPHCGNDFGWEGVFRGGVIMIIFAIMLDVIVGIMSSHSNVIHDSAYRDRYVLYIAIIGWSVVFYLLQLFTYTVLHRMGITRPWRDRLTTWSSAVIAALFAIQFIQTFSER